MLNLKKLLSFDVNQEKMNKVDNTHKIQIATCAMLLEIANADNEFQNVEKNLIISILQYEFQLSDEETNELIKKTEDEINKSIDLWQFTNLINKNFNKEEKLKILENVWKVIYADGRLDQYEDYLVHKIANLLRLSHEQLIKTKLKVSEK